MIQQSSVPEGWREVKLGSIMRIFTGRKNVNQAKVNGTYAFFSCSPDKFFYSDEYICDNDALIITGNGAYTGTVRFFSGKFDLYQRTYACVLNEKMKKHFDSKFLYYYVKERFESRYMGGSRGSIIPYIVKGDIENFLVPTPLLPEQKAIAEILSSLDDKIDLLHRQNTTLENMAQTLFRKWFVEDADENWEEVTLGDYFPIITGKKNSHYATENGPYPFFTCASNAIRAPSYSFEGNAILLAGNGHFNIKRYNGQFEAYQRTYVLIPYEEKYAGFLYTLIKFYLYRITEGAQGSVIEFITKSMIADFKFSIPSKNFDAELKIINDFYAKIDSNQSQIRTLENLRNLLLPKLMSGKVRMEQQE